MQTTRENIRVNLFPRYQMYKKHKQKYHYIKMPFINKTYICSLTRLCHMKFQFVRYAIWVLLLVSCHKTDSTDPTYPSKYGKTVIVYLAGDNNLSSEVDSKIEALSSGFRNVDGKTNKLIVFADYRNNNSQLLEISNSGVILLDTFENLNAADPATLKKVITRVYSTYPSESYGIICFSHASGWLPQGAFSDPSEYESTFRSKSLIMDNDQEMSIEDFSEAVKLPDGSKYDFILFETCHMAGIEIAYSLRNIASRMIASSAEIVSPGFLDTYKNNLDKLFSPDADVCCFASSFFDHWNSQSGARRSATVTVMNLENFQLLASEVGRIIKQSKYLISQPENIQHFDRNLIHMFFDLREYLLAMTGGDQSKLTYFDTLMDDVVMYENATPYFMTGYPYSFKIDKHSGITIYIMQPELESLNEAYQKTDFYKDNLN